ncbi:GNAT family N-acetyltransferase [Ectobacillus ponti]|uniref:GNAT family N-acetyltransferase n=1 Tax=Ectobacillus ponti TaxID=2961894 RepID=A0AA41X445_9BACI|nr:GNAT family N-acetyltransferase [Ectobacillus ponti]MCP8968609.1 GNAT family N-acetyltransferase [Ectobacillus ponti]
MDYIKGYRNQEQYRRSFDELAQTVFGISFADWHAKGYWTEQYEPHSYRDGDQIVANVSVNKLDLVMGGERKRAIQIGTVMTHPEYRGRGLSADLMHRVLAEYEGQYDIMYLFANHSVLEFYPKFGFQAVEEHQFTMKYTGTGAGRVRQLGEQDLPRVYEFARRRVPVSQDFGTANAAELLMFYCTAVFPQNLYYLEDLDVIVLARQVGNELHLFDVVSKREVELEQVLQAFMPAGADKAVLHFTGTGFMDTRVYEGSEVLFVKANGLELPAYFKHPVTSQA